ncbi:MAG: glycoside hydrolase family 57 protein [Spongiibacteraceae bacterium]
MKVVLCWHMHQPEYRDLRTGEYRLPWTYLHGMKDYVDMVAHLERYPNARAVVNFAPVLLDQIDDYCSQIRDYFDSDTSLRDPLLATLASDDFPQAIEDKLALWKQLLRVNRKRVVDRFPAYARMARLVEWYQENPDAAIYANDQFSIDLSVWYHLGWIAETHRRGDARIKKLETKGEQFTRNERREMLGIVLELMQSIIPRYRTLAEQGRVELALSPYAHPIVPLLLDLNSAHEAMPAAPLPQASEYPGGDDRARWHLQRGIATFEKYFGHRPKGCWPSEGSVSTATLSLLGEFGLQWAASGETVLRNSIEASRNNAEASREQGFKVPADVLHRAYRVEGCGETVCFFRDDGLSDKIGFQYADWHGDDAVANLIYDLEHIAAHHPQADEGVVSIILDGENAWEYYPENGFYFLDALYEKLSEHSTLEMTTFSAVIESGLPTVELPKLIAGSWVYGTFSTWIGSADKNRGWDLLCAAKTAFDEAMSANRLDQTTRARAEMQMAICEGSDWFWWFGDYNPAAAVSDFEQLFRLHVCNLYEIIGAKIPENLQHVISAGSGDPARGGVMLPGQVHAS